MAPCPGEDEREDEQSWPSRGQAGAACWGARERFCVSGGKLIRGTAESPSNSIASTSTLSGQPFQILKYLEICQT